MNTCLLLLFIALVSALPLSAGSAPFTYQGVLSDSGQLAQSSYDFRFRICAVETGGAALAEVYTENLLIHSGHFLATLDFGNGIFNGQSRWLEIAVRPAGSLADYSTLVPRQLITAVPYAITAENLAGANPAHLNEIGSSNIFNGTIQSPLRVQGDSSQQLGEIRVAGGEVVLSGDDSSSDHHGTRLLLQAGNGMGPDKNGGNIVFLPGGATGAGRAGRVVIDGAVKVTGYIAATALFADGSGIINLSASNLTGVLGNQQFAGSYVNAVQLSNPANQFHGTFSGDGNALSNLTASAFVGVVPGGGLMGTYANALDFINSGNRINGTFSGTFAGDGSSLNNVTASAFTGILPNAGLSGAYAQVVNLANASNSVFGSFFGDGSALSNLQASRITGALNSEHLAGSYDNAVQFTSPSNQFAGAFQGDGTGLTVSASRLLGTLPGGALSGTYGLTLNLMNPANSLHGAFTGNGIGLSNVNASELEGLASGDFAQRHSSNFFSAGQTFAAPVLFSNAVSIESNLQVSGVIMAAKLSGNGFGLQNLAASNLVGVLGSAQLQGAYANPVQLTSGANQFNGAFNGNGAGLANLNASALTGLVPGTALSGTYGNPLNLPNPSNTIQGTFTGDGSRLTNLAASNLVGVLASARLQGVYSNALQFSNSANQFNGTFTGDGSSLSNIAAATLTGSVPGSLLSGPYNNALTLGNPANTMRGSFDGDGNALNNLNASALSTGTVPDGRLSANVVLLNSSPLFSGSVTAQGDLLASRLSVGSVGINITNPAGRALLVNGPAGITGTNTLEFGANVAGKHVNAGKIGYQTFTPGALDIVGAGTNLGSRRIKFWAEGGATFNAASTNPVVTMLNTIDEPTAFSLVAPFRTWRVGQNKPPDNPNIIDAFYIRDETANATRLLITDTGRVGLGTNNPAHPLHLANGAHCTAAGVWTSVSDRHAKESFRAINSREILAKVASLPITEWKYKVEPRGTRHIGPTAQDFHAAFGLGETDKGIGMVDAAGVAMAAIQGLNDELKQKDVEIRSLKETNQALTRRLELLEESVRLLVLAQQK